MVQKCVRLPTAPNAPPSAKASQRIVVGEVTDSIGALADSEIVKKL
jgi:hypothetical protein